MYVAMGIGAFLCFFIGIYPQFLYSMLPFEAHYVPYTAWHILQISILLGFTGYGFYLMVRRLTPEARFNVDFEFFYIMFGRLFLVLCRYPFALADTWWSEVYRTGGLRGMLGAAKGSSVFDRVGIDGVVDGTAGGVRTLGRVAARAQTGRLQTYIAGAVLTSLVAIILALILLN
jgi:multicomponent Na+:H+ antiporter subunit D